MENIKIITLDDGIGVFENAFPLDVCESIIDYFEWLNNHGIPKNRQQSEDIEQTLKNDLSFPLGIQRPSIYFGHEVTREVCNLNKDYDAQIKFLMQPCYNKYREKYYFLDQLERHGMIFVKIQKTEPGQGYHLWHAEYSKSMPYRILSVLVYLNDVEEGGETEFLFQRKRIKPKAGTAVIFPAYFTHPHRGNPPLSNNKYILSSWYEFI